MHAFIDSEKREWKLSLNFRSLERLRDNGCDLTDPKVVVRLGDDPYQLGAALWCLVEPQAEKASVDPDDFAEACADGEVIESAVTALVNELILFTRPARRPAMTKALAAKRAMEAKAIKAAEAMLDGGSLDKEMDKAIAKMQSELASTN